MEAPELKDLTPEQIKEVSKILSKARWRLSWIAVKFASGLFLANITSLIVAFVLFKDSDPDYIKSFQFVAMFLNFIFMASYLSGQIKANSDIVSTGIKEILKKSEQKSEHESTGLE